MSIENDLTNTEPSTPDSETTTDDAATCLRNRLKQKQGMSIDHDRAEKKPNSTEDKATTTDEEAGCLMDILHLHMLQLIEEEISQKLTLEAHLSRARLILARTRLQQGTQRTAAAPRLPGSTPYRALCRLLEQSTSWGTSLKLCRFAVEAALGYLQPVTHIFGALVPYSLRVASSKWERSVEQIVECVNVQRELQSVVRSIERLKWALLHRRCHI